MTGWTPAIDWTQAKRSPRPGPCKYRCGMQAWLIEPGDNRVAHKVCADAAAGIVTPEVTPLAELPDTKAEPRPLGCGTPAPGQTSGKVCAVVTGRGEPGSTPSCQLCPHSPSYWRGRLEPPRAAALPAYDGPAVDASA